VLEAVPRDLENLVEQQRSAFAARFGHPPAYIASAPGRINVIGEHTDYNRGLALPGAIDRWIVATLSLRTDGLVRVHSEAFDETVQMIAAQADAAEPGGPGSQPMVGDRAGDDARSRTRARWAGIPRGALALLQAGGAHIAGCDVLIGGNLPRGAGVASSAAVEMALLNALRAAFGAPIDDLALVRLAQRIEHDFLGVQTGLMDQYTAQLAHPGNLMLVDFDRLAHRNVPARVDGWVWLLLDSGVRHELAGSAYGERVEQMAEALARVAAADATVACFRDLLESHVDLLDDTVLRRRLHHYVRENDRVSAAAAAVATGNAVALGALMLASHASLRDDYEVSCAELDLLVDAAASAPGCAGARLMGGGFGGCTLNLVRADAVEAFVAEVAPAFERGYGRVPAAAVYRLVGGAALH
jgi:galactokinase